MCASICLNRTPSVDDTLVLSASSKADKLDHLSPESDGCRDKGSFVGVDNGAFPKKVCFTAAHERSALENFPEDVQNRCNPDHGYGGSKISTEDRLTETRRKMAELI